MNTFMPHDNFQQSVQCLDYRRLGKQRVEVKQIYKALTEENAGWKNHPATKMWKGYERALLMYGMECCREWISRGYNDNLLKEFITLHSNLIVNDMREGYIIPHWVSDKKSIEGYRSNLLRKDYNHYIKYFPDTQLGLPYTWGVITDDTK